MAYFLSPIGNAQYVDSSGSPLSGAKLFTYTAGSSTKVTTYKNNTGSASHANPIVLDSDGRPESPIWLVGGTSVKFVLAPSNDTDPPASAIETWDNVDGVNDITAVDDSSLNEWIVGPTPTYVSATQFTVAGDQTSYFEVNRRVKCVVSAGTVYGYVSVSAYTTLTTVTVVLDSGSLDSGLSSVSYSILGTTNPSYPQNIVTLAGTQTLTNKTLTSPTIATPTITGAITHAAGIQVGSPTGGAKGASTINLAGLGYSNNKQFGRIVTGTLTATTLAAGSEQTATVTHGLGTDDVFIVLHGIGATNENWVALGKRVDGSESVIRGTANSSTSMIGPVGNPSSGDINVSVRNDHGSAQTITIKYAVIG